jgi:predicted nucleic acid-binding protein
MPGHFWDTSALVKHYHPELGTAKVDILLQASGHPQLFSVARLLVAHHKEAERLLRRYGPMAGQGIRTLDALQLAVALDLRNKRVIDTLISADARLIAVAQSEGFDVVDPEQP